MIRIYKDTGKGGNGSFTIQTDAESLDGFIDELEGAVLQVIKAFPGDEEFTMAGILPLMFDIGFKIAGYKNDKVAVQQLLTSGYANPNCFLAVDTSRKLELRPGEYIGCPYVAPFGDEALHCSKEAGHSDPHCDFNAVEHETWLALSETGCERV